MDARRKTEPLVKHISITVESPLLESWDFFRFPAPSARTCFDIRMRFQATGSSTNTQRSQPFAERITRIPVAPCYPGARSETDSTDDSADGSPKVFAPAVELVLY